MNEGKYFNIGLLYLQQHYHVTFAQTRALTNVYVALSDIGADFVKHFRRASGERLNPPRTYPRSNQYVIYSALNQSTTRSLAYSSACSLNFWISCSNDTAERIPASVELGIAALYRRPSPRCFVSWDNCAQLNFAFSDNFAHHAYLVIHATSFFGWRTSSLAASEYLDSFTIRFGCAAHRCGRPLDAPEGGPRAGLHFPRLSGMFMRS